MKIRPNKRRFIPPGDFVKFLRRQGLVSHRNQTTNKDYILNWLDLTPLQIHASPLTPIVELQALSGDAHATITGEKLLHFLPSLKRIRTEKGYATTHSTGYIVLLLGGALYKVPHQLTEALKTFRIAVIDRTTIQSVLDSPTREQRLTQLASGLTRFLGIQLLSPYAMGKPVFGSQFFGRRQALERILGAEGENFTLFGIRQIGKTSLMREVEHRIRIADPRARIARMYSSRFNRPDDYLRAIIRQLEPKLNDSRTGSILETFAEELQSIPQKSGDQVVAFLDEFDRVIYLEQFEDFQMLEILRQAFDHESCRVFFAGFRRVREAALRTDSPLRNFTRPEEVGALTQDETTNMIEVPIRRLGIPQPPKDLTTAVFQETSGHPVLIQIFCTALVDFFSERAKLPEVPEFLELVLESSTYRDVTKRTFLMNTSPFEKLVCYLLIQQALRSEDGVENFEFDDEDILKLIRTRGKTLRVEESEALVSHLLTGGIISRVAGAGGRRYEFLVPQLARYYRGVDLEMPILEAVGDIDTAFDRDSALFG